MTDYSMPLLLGYVLRPLLLTDDELVATRERLERFAAEEGFAMGTIYVEVAATTPAAFEALVEAVNRYDVTAVVVPSLLHFAALSAVKNIKDTFERATGARVIVATTSP
jgi:citrate lyase beta subunit